MKLRFKLMIIILVLVVFFALFTLILLLQQQFGSSFISDSEAFTLQLYDETSQINLRYGRIYYGRSNRLLINSLYSIQNTMLNGIIVNQVNYYSENNQNFNLVWTFAEITDINVLRQQYPNQYSTLVYLQQFFQFYSIITKRNLINKLSIICSNGIGIQMFSDTMDQEWHQQLYSQCASSQDCSDFINKTSSIITTPNFDQNHEIWLLRTNECVVAAKQDRILDVGTSNQDVTISLYTNGSAYKIENNGTIVQSDLEQILSASETDAEELIDEIFNTSLQPFRERKFRIEYEGISNESRLVFFTAYYFINSFDENPLVVDNTELLRNASILYLESADKSYYDIQSGSNDQAYQYLINQLILSIVVFTLIFLYTWRKSVVIALSLEVPLKQIIKLMKVDMIYLETSTFSHDSYSDLFNNKEIYKLYKVLINYLNNIKYSNNKLLQGTIDEAEALIILSMSKQFYKKYNNMAAVGICANNIAKIHMKNHRYIEAMNEQEESVLIANQDLQSLKEMQNIAFQAAEQNEEQKLYELYLRLKNKVLQKFQRQEEPIIKNIQIKAKSIQNLTSNMSRKNTFIKQKQSEVSPNMKMSVDSEIPRLTSPRPNNWSKTPIQEIRSDQVSEPILSQNHSSNSLSSQKQEFRQQQMIIEHKIVFRKYSLACILFHYSLKKSQSTFLNESVILFNQIMDDAEQLPESYSINYMKIDILTKKTFCYAKAGMIEKAKNELRDAIYQYRELEHNKNIKQLDIQDFVDIFKDVPLEILYERISCQEAVLMMLRGEYSNSCEKFISILSAQGPYDPSQHKFVLQSLYKIFTTYGLNTDCLLKFQKGNQRKKLEIIFLIDYSNEMTAEQYTLSHSMCKFIIQNVNSDSCIGLYAYNDSIYEIFPLQSIQTYKNLFEKSLEQLLVVPGGEGNIFNALEMAIAYLYDHDKIDVAKQLSNHLKSNKLREIFIEVDDNRISLPDFHSKQITSPKYSNRNIELRFETESIRNNQDYFVDLDKIEEDQDDDQTLKYLCLFSEGVTNYSKLALDRIQNLVNRKKVHLLVCNIANQNMNMLYLKQLASVSSESKFFTNEADMLNFFQQLKPDDYNKRLYLEFF